MAIKVPRAGNLATDEDRDRFLREARSVAQLRHPAIVPVHEVGEHDGVPYLVSDFVQGVTLADLLTARRPRFREAAELVAEVADALQYAHEQGVVHRDVKPSNIMLDDDGPAAPDGLRPGQARRGRDHHDDRRPGAGHAGLHEPRAGPRRGAPGRRPQRRLQPGRDPLRAADRRAAVPRQPRGCCLHQVLHDEPRPPRRLNDRIPRDLETICLKAMAKEPARRYATAQDLADDLRRWLDGEPIQARPVGPFERSWRWCRRNPRWRRRPGSRPWRCSRSRPSRSTFAVQQSRGRQDRQGAREDQERPQQVQTEQANTKNALAQVKTERDTARTERDKASRLATTLSLRQGQAFDAEDDPASGLLWMARA